PALPSRRALADRTAGPRHGRRLRLGHVGEALLRQPRDRLRYEARAEFAAPPRLLGTAPGAGNDRGRINAGADQRGEFLLRRHFRVVAVAARIGRPERIAILAR